MKELRTKPGVQSSTGMTKKSGDRWEIRLGIAHVVVVLGLITGSMTLAFYLGFFAGKDAGYDVAMEQNATTLAKLPITQDSQPLLNAAEVAEKAVSEVYAKLADQKIAAPEITEIPSLEAIKPLQEPSTVFEDSETNTVTESESAIKVPSAVKEDVSSGSEPKTLGDELPAEVTVAAAVPTKNSPPPTNTPKPTPTKIIEPTSTPVPIATPKPKENKAEQSADLTAKSIAPAPTSKIAAGWYAQVAAPTLISEAQTIATKLRANGFAVIIENADVRGERYFRILVGPESNRKQAEALVQQLKREAYLAGAPFIRVVK